MQAFTYQALSQRVIFGFGTLEAVAAELAQLGGTKALVLSTAQQRDSAEQLAAALGDNCVGVYANAVMHTPVEVTRDAMAEVTRLGADCVIALGGGSTTGLGKAIAFRTDLPQIVIPTSYAGSEATPILGETEQGEKVTKRDLKILPEVIVYDVDLTMTLPPAMTVTSGINAIAHAVEALYTKDRNPIISMLAQQGIEALARALATIRATPNDRDARSDALYGAWACGTCLGAVGMALHHKVCHVLGGSFELPHAETHTVILPHAVAYNEAAARAELAPVAQIFKAESAATGLWDFAKGLDAPMTLAEIGMAESDLDQAADLIVANPYWNPQPLERGQIRQFLDDAFHGRRPASKRA